MTPSRFVQGVVVPPRVCLFLENKLDLFNLSNTNHGDAEIEETLYAIRWTAMASRANATRAATPHPDEATSTMITPRQAAGRIDLKEGSICAAIRRGKLPAMKVDGRWRINSADLDTYRSAP